MVLFKAEKEELITIIETRVREMLFLLNEKNLSKLL